MAFSNNTDQALKISINLGASIDRQVSVLDAVRKVEQATKEAKFQQLVIDNGLTYDAQIAYRKKQIQEEKNVLGAIDNPYVTALESDLTNLRKLNRFKKIREDYLTSYEDLKAGKISLQTHAGFLQTQLDNAKTEDERTQIRDELSTVRTQIADSEINTLKNRVLVAQKDGTISVLNNAIGDISTRKAFANLSGNAEEASMWDVSLVSLKKQLNETQVANAVHDFDFQIGRSGFTASQKLDSLNTKISSADSAVPITINGVTYGSAKDFWTTQRDGYLSGTSTDPNFSNFFKDFETEVKDKMDTVSKISVYGAVPTDTLKAIQSDYDQLASKAEFQPLISKLNVSKTAAMAYGVDKSASAIIESSVNTLQVKTGQALLDNLTTQFGIDVSSRKTELDQKIIEKGSQLPGIKQATTELGKVGAETPSPEVLPKYEPTNVANQSVPKPLVNPPASEPSTVFNPTEFIGSRPSPTNPTVTEFYNKQTTQGYANPKALYTDFIGKRQSPSNPAVTEYYNKKNPSQGFANEGELFSFASSLGLGKVNSFGQLGV